MTRAVLGLLFLFALVDRCEQAQSRTGNEHVSAFVPLVTKAELPARKGVGLYAGGCDLLYKLGVQWYYSGESHCPGFEFVEYITHAGDMGKTPTSYTMLWNEPEYRASSVEEMVAAFVPVAEANPDVVWVGPCPAYDLSVIPEFWQEFERQAGCAMDPKQIRVCLHCYHGADRCMELVTEGAWLGMEMGIPTPAVWLTEFGQAPGLDMTIGQQVAEMARLVDSLQRSQDVERYAWWPGLLRANPDVADGRPTGWQPLGYDFWSTDRQEVVGVRLTDAGRMYRGR